MQFLFYASPSARAVFIVINKQDAVAQGEVFQVRFVEASQEAI